MQCTTHREHFVDDANKSECCWCGELAAPPSGVTNANSDETRKEQRNPRVWLGLVVIVKHRVLDGQAIKVLQARAPFPFAARQSNHHTRMSDDAIITSVKITHTHLHTHTHAHTHTHLHSHTHTHALTYAHKHTHTHTHTHLHDCASRESTHIVVSNTRSERKNYWNADCVLVQHLQEMVCARA
jgi:hypothetical protein